MPVLGHGPTSLMLSSTRIRPREASLDREALCLTTNTSTVGGFLLQERWFSVKMALNLRYKCRYKISFDYFFLFNATVWMLVSKGRGHFSGFT